MDYPQAQQQLTRNLQALYDEREAAAIAGLVMEKLTGLGKMDRLIRSRETLDPAALDIFQKYSSELLAHRPVQYVLGESWFCGMKFLVDERVLIPRPETEELVEWALSEIRSQTQRSPASAPDPTGSYSILDVGTGSGCIAIAVEKGMKRPHPRIYACDLSPGALEIARRNANSLGASIELRQLDFLDPAGWHTLPPMDLVISNPPYIPKSEQHTLSPHVADFEPHLALFAEGNDPLIFYKALARFAQGHLRPGGLLMVEIHEGAAAGVQKVFRDVDNGIIEGPGAGPLFEAVRLRQDMQGRDRMVMARKATW